MRKTSIPVPIWLKLSLSTTTIIAFTIIAMSYIVLNRQKDQLYNQSVRAGTISLNYFVNNSKIPLINDDTLRLNTLLKEASSVEGIMYAIILNEKNIIKAHTDIKNIGKKLKEHRNAGNEIKDGEVRYYNYINSKNEKILNLSRPVAFNDKQLGEVHVGVSIDFIEDLINKEKLSIIVFAVIIIFFGILISTIMSFGFSRPIKRLVKAADEVGKGNYKYRIETKRSRDELGDLSDAFNNMAEELWRDSLMKESFGKYVGSEVLDMILKNPESTWLKGRRNEATILFADIRGFTSYSESREPEKVVETLNRFFEITSSLILKHGGYVDKFIGDAVLAVFGVPVYNDNHAEMAVRAAIEIQAELESASKAGIELLSKVGIGINSGVIVSGNIGSNIRMEYTVIGDPVNLASRLNGLAGPGDVIISKSVREEIENIITVEALPSQKVKGKSQAVETFKVIQLSA